MADYEELTKSLRTCATKTLLDDCQECKYDEFTIEENGRYCYETLIAQAADAIEELTRAKGKWTDVRVVRADDIGVSSMKCSNCDRYHNEVYYYSNPTEMAHYCPNCGADMKG